MDWLGWMVAGAGLLGVVGYVALRKMVPDAAVRRQLWNILLAKFRQAPVEEAIDVESDHPDDKAAEPGNVKPVPAEAGVEPDKDLAYAFPSKLRPPVTRFEDLNRRLIVFGPSAATLEKGKLPKRAPDDFPLRVTCSTGELADAIAKELRPYYRVIIDRHGQFAEASRILELNPTYQSTLISQYLKIPENDRPVVVSQVKADSTAGVPGFVFQRYGYESLFVAASALNFYYEDSLSYLFDAFLSEDSDNIWQWFSVARLRAHTFEKNKPLEEAKAEIAKQLYRNRFATLWNMRFDPEEAKPSDVNADKAPDGASGDAEPTATTQGAPA